MRRMAILFVLPALALATPAVAQTGRIVGKVMESLAQRPLPGATVSVPGVETRATTDSAGNYSLSNVPIGSHVVRASRIGFAASEERVTVAASQPVTANLVLQATAVAL